MISLETKRHKSLPPGHPDGLKGYTNIDRRHATRNVPLKVICVGLPRTGTCSLRTALIDLGYFDVYHMSAVLNENPRDADIWTEALLAKFEGKGKPFDRRDFDGVLGHCEASTDYPSVLFWRELIEAYPDAKVILTVRDSTDQWSKSQASTLLPFAQQVVLPNDISSRIFRFFCPPGLRKAVQMNQLLCKHSMYSLPEDQFGAFYESHNAEVQERVSSDRLLVFNVKQGWKPLCDFLGLPARDEPFPRVNETEDFNRNQAAAGKIIARIALFNMAKTAIVVCGVAAGVLFLLRRRPL